MHEIIPQKVWIGHAGDLQHPRTLNEADILAVVDLAVNEPPAQLPREMIYLPGFVG
jgi:hypothetical protein